MSDPTSSRPSSAGAPPAAVLSASAPARVLHVDDDDANRYAVSRSLRKAGFDVVEAATGRDALARAQDLPDVVILDVRLPDVSGFDVCRQIKADPATAGIPVLHLSANFISGKDKAVGLDGGADAYLVRPVEPVELVATVNALLRQKRTEEALKRANESLAQANGSLAQANESLRASESRFRFLGDMGEATRDQTDPERVMADVARRLGEHLGASRCAYADVEPDADRFTIRHDYTVPGLPSSTGAYKLDLFGSRAAADMRDGRTLVVRDVDRELAPADGADTFNAIGIKAIVCCPLVKDGDGAPRRLVAMMAVHQAAPRNWSAAEVALVEEVVERSWAYIERARARRALAETEDLLRRVVDGVQDYAIFTVDPDGVITTWNAGAERVLGYPEAEAVGLSTDRLFTEEDQAAGVPARERAAAASDGRSPDVRWHRRKDGSRLFVDGVMTALRGPDGALVGFSKLMRDVTDRRRAEEALRESQERLRMAVQASALGYFSLDPATDAVAFDDANAALFDAAPAELTTSAAAFARIHPDDHEPTRRAVAAALAGDAAYEAEFRVVRPGGGVRWVAAKGDVVRDAAGRVTGLAGVNWDVTARKQVEAEAAAAQAAVAQSEARFRAMANTIPQLAWTTRADGHVEWYNDRWYQYTGTAPADVEGWGWQQVFDPAALPQVTDRWRASLATGDPFEMEIPIRGADGTYRPFLSRAAALRGPGGTIAQWFGTNTDVSAQRRADEDRKRLLEQERQARAAAEEANRLKDEFLATLSHELRTPLNAIVGWAGVLSALKRGDPDLAEGLGAIDRNARVQAQLIEDLLDVSRIISGKLRLDVQRTDLAPVVEAALASVMPAARNKAIRLQPVLEAAGATVWGDPARLQQVVWNLVANAIKFTPKEGRVQVRLARVNSHVEIVVADSGRGIGPEFLPYVFERFRQADATTTRAHGGLGLGLAIVKHLVEQHGGTVHVASEGDGKGATFTVRLPLAAMGRDPSAEDAVHPRSGQGGGVGKGEPCPEPSLAGLRVLVVDDEPDARHLLRRFLEQCDVVATLAGSAAEAMAAVSAGRFDVIVSDIGMPEEDGYDLIRRIRALPADAGGRTPAVALTAFARTEDRRRALLAGFQIHVPKPVDPAELLAVIANVAGRTGAKGR